MALLSLQNASMRFGGEPLLDDVTLNIEKGERICLVGRNGCGKTTLLKILAGEIEPDSGERFVQNGVRIAWLPQEVPHDIAGTVRSVVEGGLPENAPAHSAESAIDKLGLDPDADFASLSGGMKRRALLARAISCSPDLLILDEPTNHLDIESVEWLENFLRTRVDTFLFVTHDRAFLRHLAGKIVDLDRGKLVGWDCDYDTFVRRKEQVLADEAVIYERMEKKLVKEEAWLRRGVKARTTRNEGRVRALVELRRQFAGRRMEQGTGKMEIQGADKSGVRAMRIKGVSFGYPGGREIIHDFSIDILRGERIALIGPNGAGKTTLLKLVAGLLNPTSGEVIPGSNVRVTYFDQLRSALDGEKSVLENVADGRDTITINGRTRHVYAYLQDFLFDPDRSRTPVKALSGGERNRLLLARHFLEPGNFLAMDEPTNDLDVETLDLLEEQLAAFDGTILIVSHDRAFINNVVTSTIVIGEDGSIKQYAGGYDDYVAAKRNEAKPAPAAAETPRRQAEAPTAPVPEKRKLGFNEKRELEAIPGKIEALEKEESDLNAALLDPEIYKKPAADIKAMQERLAAIASEMELLLARWAELEEMAK